MLYYLASFLTEYFGPARLLQSYAVLLCLAVYAGFIVTWHFLPKFYDKLPHDRGREFTINAEAAKGKPTGAGVVFITIFVVTSILFIPFDKLQITILLLTWLSMLTGYLDDRSVTSWGEYRKALLDLVICIAASFALYYMRDLDKVGGAIQFWFPFITKPVTIAPYVFIPVSTVILWATINTTNCTDGVDGLSSMLVLIGLITMAVVFYFILGHVEIASYLLLPHFADGASWGGMIFTLVGVLMGYLWHNAYPSKVLMGDAGSRALGFFTGVIVLAAGNPFLLLATSSIVLVNGGMGLLKIALLRFFKIKIFANVRFPLHDHMRKNRGWSPTQVTIKFLILQILISIGLLGIFLKIR